MYEFKYCYFSKIIKLNKATKNKQMILQKGGIFGLQQSGIYFHLSACFHDSLCAVKKRVP